MRAASDLTTPRPWLATPEDQGRPDGPWCVVAVGEGINIAVAHFLSEEDAQLIAAAPDYEAMYGKRSGK